ncbi:MAG: haloacid dehalogenase type II [Candidatus Latescibacteria bacterium]|nr:haloacid dehalogenase type II [Candidatus Latescibacterota bacterium]
MSLTLAFDVYGTLIDTQGVLVGLQQYVGEKAPEFSRTWRDKQLEYSFRRGLMQRYENFAVCTRDALEYTCEFLAVDLGRAEKDALMDLYKVLPAFADAAVGLERAKAAGLSLFAFSNGSAAAVEGLLNHAGIRALFDGVVSTDEIQSFKPNPAVYRHFLQRADTAADRAWLVSGNPFDVIGAVGAGMRAAWVRRSPAAVFDPWDVQPTVTVEGLADIAGVVAGLGGSRVG